MLDRLRLRFFRKTERLNDHFLRCLDENAIKGECPTRKMKAEMLVIRLHSCWEGFCRQLLFISAVKRPMTMQSSQRLRRVLKNYKKFAERVVSLKQPPPKWHKATFCSDVAREIGVENADTIQVALGSQDSPITEMTLVRNFYVHPTPHTAEKAREKFRRKKSDKINLDCLVLVGEFQHGGITRYEAWITELRKIANAAIK